MQNQEIALLGAGIGGLTLAIALKRKGLENSSVFERTSTASMLGARLVVRPNVTQVLHLLGLQEQAQPVGGKLSEMSEVHF
jgi:2-polyprenyl-6-methoxyphenol hydroxylase-like FAD-dependent oxidoreductase